MKVGDIYTMQWGYDQTNNTFYRVKALRGKTQAVIQEVDLEVEQCDPINQSRGFTSTITSADHTEVSECMKAGTHE